MNCQPSLQLSPPRSLVTQPLQPLTPSDELPQHAEWHRLEGPALPANSASSAGTSSSTSHTPNNIAANASLKSLVKARFPLHPILELEVPNSVLRKWLSPKQLDDVMAMLSAGGYVR